MGVCPALLNGITEAINTWVYYAPAFKRLRTEESESCPTASMDRYLVMRYKREFIESLQRDEVKYVVLHELLHYVRNHHGRFEDSSWFGTVSPVIANICMDIEINDVMKEDSKFIMGEGQTADKYGFPEGKSFEYYIDLFMSQYNTKKGSEGTNKGQANGSNSNCPGTGGSNGDDEEEQSQQQKSKSKGKGKPKESQDSGENESLDKLNQIQKEWEKTKELAKALADKLDVDMNKDGDGSGSSSSAPSDSVLEKELNDLLKEMEDNARSKGIGSKSSPFATKRRVKEKVYDWKSLLKNIIVSKVSEKTRGRDKTTWQLPDYRMQACTRDIIFPRHYDEIKKANIVVGIDVSGSMGDLVNEMYARLKSIKRVSLIDTLTVVECDCEICNVMMNFEPVQNEIKSVSGGGTDMEQIPLWVEKMVSKDKMSEPDLIVIMTDGYTNWNPNPKHKYINKTKILVANNNLDKECAYKQYSVTI